MSKKKRAKRKPPNTREFIQDQVVSADNEMPQSPQIVSTVPAKAVGVEGIEQNANLFVSGHVVDPLIHMYDFDPTPPKGDDAAAQNEANPEDISELEFHGPEVETRFPESREVYLGLLGMLKKSATKNNPRTASENSEKEIAEWYLKNRIASRPSWGQQRAR
jgi:hypothetical protein